LITLQHSPGEEPFWGIGRDSPEHTYAGEVIYTNKEKVLTRRWNFRDCDSTKITNNSENIILFIESPDENIITKDDLATALKDMKQNIEKYCGGTVETSVVNFSSSEKITL